MQPSFDPARLPDWLGAALIGAALALMGYVARQLERWFHELAKRRNEKRARLVELSSLLRAGKTLFLVQNMQARRLAELLQRRLPERAATFGSFETMLSRLYPELDTCERELHSLVRSATIHGMHPINMALLDWIKADATFRTSRARRGTARELADALHQLEAHLLIWKSKYAAWIPDKPENALVYLGDEQAHGPPFPQDIDAVVEKMLA